MSSVKLDEQERARRWREVWSIYLIMTLGTLLVDQLANALPVLASISVLIIALGFIFLPTEYLLSRGEAPQQFGIGGKVQSSSTHFNSDITLIESRQEDKLESSPQVESSFQRAFRCSKQALWIALLVFPLFVAGNHVWRQLQGQSPDWSPRALSRWDESIRGLSYNNLKVGEINTSASLDHIKLKWLLQAHEKAFTATLDLESATQVIAKSRGVKVIRPKTPSNKWLIKGKGKGYVLIKTQSTQVKVSAQADQKIIPLSRLTWGEYHQILEYSLFERDFSWLWSIFLIQLFLVGLPEEIFYRGYLQTRLDSLVGQDKQVLGVAFNWQSTVLCSGLFAIAHLVTILHPSRLAVFFPSLLFGWMRRAYGDTLSPAIFHAACNVLSQVLWGIYFI